MSKEESAALYKAYLADISPDATTDDEPKIEDFEDDEDDKEAEKKRSDAVLAAWKLNTPPEDEDSDDEEDEEEDAPTPKPQPPPREPTTPTGKPKNEPPHLRVYKWCQNLSAEQSRDVLDDQYLQSTEFKHIIRRLTTTDNNMIAVIGNQGSGKTTMQENLRVTLQADYNLEALSFKWRGNPALFDDLVNLSGGTQMERYQSTVTLEAYEIVHANPNTKRCYEYDNDIRNAQNAAMPEYSAFKRSLKEISPARLAKLQYEAVIEIGGEGHVTLLVDFPDFDKKNKGEMLKTLARFREWWDAVVSYSDQTEVSTYLNLIIFFQKELWGGHFAFGKFDVVEIKPFTAQQITDYYIQLFNGSLPFEVEALMYLAGLSRGIIRWFKKYVRVCLDNYYDQLDEGHAIEFITVNEVKSWITVTQLVEDWDRELMEIMKSKGERRKAVEVMRYLFETKGATQKDITDRFFGAAGKSQASRLLSRLELYGYTSSKRDGRENIITFVG